MASFTRAELDYLLGERRLGRLATVDATGQPHVVPVGWRYDDKAGAIDISGHNFAVTKKFRNVQATGKAALVVDDLASTRPWRPRMVMVQGAATAISGQGGEAFIRIIPETIVSRGL